MYYYIPIPSQRIHAKEKRKKRSSRKQKAKQNQPNLVYLKRKKKRQDEKGYPHRTKHNSNPTHLKSQSQHNQTEDHQR